MRLILPNRFVDKKDINAPLFFLVGPVLGGGNWQEACCEKIKERVSDFFAVVPCRWESVFSTGVEGRFNRQTGWEYFYLDLCCRLSQEHKGCIIFWLPEESKTHPRDDDQPYARDTRGELGRWGKCAGLTNGHIVVGAEQGFPGLSVIRRNLDLDFNQLFPICSTLEETVKRATQWAIGC